MVLPAATARRLGPDTIAIHDNVTETNLLLFNPEE